MFAYSKHKHTLSEHWTEHSTDHHHQLEISAKAINPFTSIERVGLVLVVVFGEFVIQLNTILAFSCDFLYTLAALEHKERS